MRGAGVKEVPECADRGAEAGGVMDVREIVDSVVEVVEPLARQKGLAVASRCAADLPPRVCGDAHQVEEVLLALARSAVASTDSGFVAISARPVTQGEGGRGIELLVRDTGTQAREIGSEACAGLVTRLNGRLQVESLPGEGTTMRLVFPAPLPGEAQEEIATEWNLGLPDGV